MLYLSDIEKNLNFFIDSHLLSSIASLLGDNNNAKPEPILLYN